MKSPIKYYGGKGLIAGKILSMFPEKYEYYIEPFGGGASVLFEKELSPVEIYNDINLNVYSFFKVISDSSRLDELRKKLLLTYYSDTIRKIYKSLLNRNDISELDRAYYFFYVNKTSMNGIGGFSVNKITRRGSSKSITDYLSSIDRLPQFHSRLQNVIIHNQDAINLIKKYDIDSAMIYIDPPYHPSKRTVTRYQNDFSKDDHERLVETLLNVNNAKFILSGYDCEEYDRLNKKYKRIDMEINTLDGNKKSKKKIESFWLNYEKEGILF